MSSMNIPAYLTAEQLRNRLLDKLEHLRGRLAAVGDTSAAPPAIASLGSSIRTEIKSTERRLIALGRRVGAATHE